MFFNKVPRSQYSCVIDEVSLSRLKQFEKDLEIEGYWHKFQINSVHGLDRNAVLKTLLNHIKPIEFIPLCYTQEGEGACFYARNCKNAIIKFSEDKLTIPNPFDNNKPFKLRIILKYTTTKHAKVDVSENVLNVLKKRLTPKMLCLNKFAEDPDLSEFFPLSERKILAFVLNAVKKFKLTSINLSNNDIETLEAFKIVKGSVEFLDLRNNLISSLEELRFLKGLNVTELWLEGNPLCERYDEYNYVQSVTRFCPKIEKLDGFLLRQNGVPSFRRNFVCDISAYNVIDKFLQLYFPSFDAKNLLRLDSFYQKDAFFSVSADFTPELHSYRPYSRNLLASKSKNLSHGSGEIMQLFHKLPRVEHDPYSFTVDVMHQTEKSVVVAVTGLFRHVPQGHIFSFNRTFVLECRAKAYRISNEQLHISNALRSQQSAAFKKPQILQEPARQSQLIDAFGIITMLTKDWAKMFLEECSYNLKHALLLFVDLYKQDKVPLDAFQH